MERWQNPFCTGFCEGNQLEVSYPFTKWEALVPQLRQCIAVAMLLAYPLCSPWANVNSFLFEASP